MTELILKMTPKAFRASTRVVEELRVVAIKVLAVEAHLHRLDLAPVIVREANGLRSARTTKNKAIVKMKVCVF